MSSSSSSSATAKKTRPAVSSKTTQAPAVPAPAPTANTTAVTVMGGAGEKDMEQFVKGILDEMQTRFSGRCAEAVCWADAPTVP